MPQLTLRDSEQVSDFLRGCAVLSTGGGGEPAKGLEMIEGLLQSSKELAWVDVADLPDEAWVASAWGMGSIAPKTSEQKVQRERLGLLQEGYRYNIDRAVRELEQYAGVKIEYLVPSELGGLNTAGPMVAALQMGIPIIDGDYTGRAAPELVQSSPLVFGHSLLPISSVDGWGNTCILKEASSLEMAERIGKYLSLASLSSVFMAGCLLQGKDVKRCLVPATLTKSVQVGRAIREARERAEDPVEAVIRAGRGFRLFQGLLAKKEWVDREGYMIGTLHIEGEGADAGHIARIWLKNENHVFWVDDQVRATAPDLICVLDAVSAEPFTNTQLPEGIRVAVVGFPGADIWRTELGLTLNGPKYYGFDLAYVPIESQFA